MKNEQCLNLIIQVQFNVMKNEELLNLQLHMKDGEPIVLRDDIDLTNLNATIAPQ